jgi:hypothetical protein
MIVRCWFQEGEPLVVRAGNLREAIKAARVFRAATDEPLFRQWRTETDPKARANLFKTLVHRRNVLKFTVWK